MLVVFDIPDTNMTVQAAGALAERETLWVFCSQWRVYQGESANLEKIESILNPQLQEPKKSKRTTHPKPSAKKVNGEQPG